MISTKRTWRLMAARAGGAAAIVCALACVAPPTRGEDQPPVIDPEPVTVEPSPEDDPAIRAGIEQVQRALGGSVVDRFPTLQRATDAPVPAPAGSPRRMFRRRPDSTASHTSDALQPEAGPTPHGQVGWVTSPVEPLVVVAAPSATSPVDALRAAAAELDASANRLENLELYRSSDALRRLAQELRLDARQLAKSSSNSGAPQAE